MIRSRNGEQPILELEVVLIRDCRIGSVSLLGWKTEGRWSVLEFPKIKESGSNIKPGSNIIVQKSIDFLLLYVSFFLQRVFGVVVSCLEAVISSTVYLSESKSREGQDRGCRRCLQHEFYDLPGNRRKGTEGQIYFHHSPQLCIA